MDRVGEVNKAKKDVLKKGDTSSLDLMGCWLMISDEKVSALGSSSGQYSDGLVRPREKVDHSLNERLEGGDNQGIDAVTPVNEIACRARRSGGQYV